MIDIFSCLTSTSLRKLQQKEEQTDHLKFADFGDPRRDLGHFPFLTEHQ
jgi:hypothetical protein